jgi:hypothetical protein
MTDSALMKHFYDHHFHYVREMLKHGATADELKRLFGVVGASVNDSKFWMKVHDNIDNGRPQGDLYDLFREFLTL